MAPLLCAQAGTQVYTHPIDAVCSACHEQYNDIQMLADMALYLRNQGAAADGRHNPIPHMFWWAWNENSADTGGLVASPNWGLGEPWLATMSCS